MNINYEYYKIFYYAAKYKNITRAAAAMGSSQPNVTRVLKLLEAELGCKLFVREARGIALTEEGKRLYTHVQIAVMQLENAQEELSAQASDEMGIVEIGVTETALHLFLLDVLRSFKEGHPRVRIKIHNDTTPRLLKKLACGSLDFAVLTTPFAQQRFVSAELASFREILVGGSQYRELGKKQYKLSELKGYPWVGLLEGTATSVFYREFFLKHHTDMELDMEAATSDLLIPLIQNNFGIGFVPEKMAQPFISKQELVQIPLSCSLPKRDICLVSDKERGKSIVSARLQTYLKEAAG
ncbi:MAG: LysR family transcriptional regulator [Eubacterium sp.]|nr:LysR family transcriptional regulator [Eubacterium sp.]